MARPEIPHPPWAPSGPMQGVLWRAMWRVHGRAFLLAGAWKLLHDVVMFTEPILLELLLRHLQASRLHYAWLPLLLLLLRLLLLLLLLLSPLPRCCFCCCCGAHVAAACAPFVPCMCPPPAGGRQRVGGPGPGAGARSLGGGGDAHRELVGLGLSV